MFLGKPAGSQSGAADGILCIVPPSMRSHPAEVFNCLLVLLFSQILQSDVSMCFSELAAGRSHL